VQKYTEAQIYKLCLSTAGKWEDVTADELYMVTALLMLWASFKTHTLIKTYQKKKVLENSFSSQNNIS
jgi:hypothetical protein